jgi:hypothetical protein
VLDATEDVIPASVADVLAADGAARREARRIIAAQ